MKGLSLHQPYASLIAIGAKTWETRPFQIRHGKKMLAIHATAKSPKDCELLAQSQPCHSLLARGGITELPTAAIVAIVDVCEILSSREWIRRHCQRNATKQAERDYIFGDYAPGRFAWKLENLRRLKEPITCSGTQGLWTVPPDIEERILALL